MQLNAHHSSFFFRTLTIASALALGLVSTQTVHARQNKVDVCHMNGHGVYHLLNIAESASRAHIRHGDSNPGDLVPGSGDQFSEDCTLITFVGCPCVIDLPSGWLATAAISGVAIEECDGGAFYVESVFGTQFDDDVSLSWGKSEQCDGPTSFECSAGGNTRAISEAQYDVCVGTWSVP